MHLKYCINTALLGGALVWATLAWPFTANKVWVEFFPSKTRVYVSYTVPALKERREAYVDFTSKVLASDFYSKLTRGADFYISPPSSGGNLADSPALKFTPNKKRPNPW